MSPRNLARALGPFSRFTRRLQRRRSGIRAAARRLSAEPLEPRAMLSTTATLGFDAATFTRIPVTFRRPDGTVGSSTTAYVGQLSWSGMTGEAATVGVPASFTSFCIEGLQGVAPGRNTFATIGPAAGSPLLGVDRAELLADFWRQYGPTDAAGFADKTDSAAFQLSVWELINDGRPVRNAATNPLAAGQFSVGATGLTTQAAVRARQWLDGLDSAAPGRTAVALYALHSPTRQDQVVAVPIVDLDVDADNTGVVDRSAAEEAREEPDVPFPNQLPINPGLLVPIGGNRGRMVVEVPRGRTARLEFTADVATRARVWTNDGAEALSERSLSTAVGGGTSIFWIEALAPSVTLGDLVFTLKTNDGGPASSDIVCGTAVAVDLDVDSNNDGTIDPENGQMGRDDLREGDAAQGLVLAVHAGDADQDGVPDTQDFDGIFNRSFVPLQVRLDGAAVLAWLDPSRLGDAPRERRAGLEFTFTFSDAGMNAGAGEPPGAFRIWTKDARHRRTAADLVTSGRPVRAVDLLAAQPRPDDLLERMRTFGLITLYVEALAPTDTFQPITVSIGGGGPWAHLATTDVVHARVLEPAIDLDVDSNNDNGFERPDRSAWEEKLENDRYGLGKLVMQSSADPFDPSGSPPLADRFTPVVIALPKNLPMHARTVGVRFDWEERASGGDLQMWVRDKSPDLNWNDAAGVPHPLLPPPALMHGHRIRRGGTYLLWQINYNPATGEALVYMDGHRPTDRVTLNDVETRGGATATLTATLTSEIAGNRIDFCAASVKYIVVRDDFFYYDLQFRPEVRSALASRGVYKHSDLQYAALHRLSKAELRGLLGEFGQGANLVIEEMLYTDVHKDSFPGFKAVLYQDFAANNNNAFILAFAGTDDTPMDILSGKGYDWVENVCQGLGLESFQYQYAMQVATVIDQAKAKVAGATLSTTGHSLGGGLASAASVVTGARGTTFNSAGLHTETLRKFLRDPIELNIALNRYTEAADLITAFQVDFDFLATVQLLSSPFGVPRALGEIDIIDGPYDLEVGAAAVTAVMVPGLTGGVGVVWLALTEIRAHLMPAVFWGLLVDEGLFSRKRDTLGYDFSRF